MRATVGPDGPVATQQDGTVLGYGQDGSVRWRRQHDAGFAAAPGVASDGTVVVGSRDGTVTAYDADGTPRWQHDTPDGLFAPHLNDATPFRISDETVVLAHPRGEAIAYALNNGAVRWRVESPTRSHRPAIANGRVFLVGGRSAGSEGSVVIARSLADGTEQWRTRNDGSVSIGLGVNDDTVYAANIDGLLVARSAADGTERWRVRLDGEPWLSTIPVVFGGRVWVGTLSAGLYAITAAGVQAHAAIDTPTTPAIGGDRLYVGSSEFGTGGSAARGAVLAFDADASEQWRGSTRGVPESAVHYHDGRVVCGTSTGVVETRAARDGTRRWQAFERPPELPAPAVGPATVYCGSRDRHVGGYRVRDGTGHLWRVPFDGAVPGTPVVAGQTVLAGSHAGDIAGTPPLEYADPPTGRLTRTSTPDSDATSTSHIDAPAPEPRWRRSLDGRIEDIGYGNGRAYLGSGASVVSITTGGDVRWKMDVGGSVRAAPAVDAGVVYATRTDGAVVALAAEDGTEQWRQVIGRSATAPVVVDTGGSKTLVVGTDVALVALEAATGAERWRMETGRVRGAPAVAAGTIVAGDDTGRIRGVALSDGGEQWHVETGGPVHGAPAIADGVVYVGSRDRRLYAVSVHGGAVNWTLELPDWVDGSPAVAYGGVFVVDQSGFLSVVVGDQ